MIPNSELGETVLTPYAICRLRQRCHIDSSVGLRWSRRPHLSVRMFLLLSATVALALNTGCAVRGLHLDADEMEMGSPRGGRLPISPALPAVPPSGEGVQTMNERNASE